MKNKVYYLSFLIAFVIIFSGKCQQIKNWTLEEMIQYATTHNIQVKQSVLTNQNDKANYEQVKASRLPSLSISGQQTTTTGRSIDPVTSEFVAQTIHATNLSINSQVTLFNGNTINNTIKQTGLQTESSRLDVEETQNSITISLIQGYLQALYYKEGITTAQNAANSSKKQVDQMEQLFQAGSKSASELAQLKSQYATDKSNLVSAQNQYTQQILTLKQLLELEITDEFEITTPAISDTINLTIVNKNQAYQKALAYLPEIKNSRLGIDIASLSYKIARANYYPTVTLSGSVSTAYTNVQSYTYLSQLENNRNGKLALAVSIPVFNKKSTSTSVKKAQIEVEKAKYEVISSQKTVLKNIETTHQNLVASKSKLEASQEELEAAKVTYNLAEQQFQLGMLDPVELLVKKTALQSAQQSFLQAKYTAILNYQLLEFYQGNPIKL